jgi:hypothetical protein
VRGQGHVSVLAAVEDVAHAGCSGCACFGSQVGGKALGWKTSQDVQQAGEQAPLQPEPQLVTLLLGDGCSCGSQGCCEVWVAGVGQRSQDLRRSEERQLSVAVRQ